MEKEGGLPEAGVINQPLPSEEKIEEASRKSALAVSDSKETVQTESYEGPIRVALEEAVAEKQPEMDEEEKKKKKIKEKRAEGDEEAWPRKEKKEIKMSERRERRREKERLKKKGEKRKRAESPKVDGESTTTRAVSYTHLDVYKRQVAGTTNHRRRRFKKKIT
ncbi:glutamic acid-rich protein-like [Benincasa hispida]|uniref:glutamic acid-rich protein-like n=1 Tax=Benincasa hispida TaxID=102211 RepID=UPI001902975D|nr:glutamic acid-rich protein-like [Benincasa hispida]